MRKVVKKKAAAPRQVAASSREMSHRGFVYQIETGVPFPEKQVRKPRQRFKNYPFDQMDVGDSFVIPEALSSTVRMATYQYNKVAKEEGNDEKRLAVRVLPNGEIRCFRIS